MKISEKSVKQLHKILDHKAIHPVYQPIVSLKDGSILGYEALSRFDITDCTFNVEEMFVIAENMDKLWELESLCRKKTLKAASSLPSDLMLFINVDPNIINDPEFQEGFTAKYLTKYNLTPEQIAFEITERTSISDSETFQKTLTHYRKQNYSIAIDDCGSGYSDISRVCFLAPQYIKLDISMIRDINIDTIKQSMVECFTNFCKNTNIRIIAEGVETVEELRTLVELGVDYGQGYLFKRPDSHLSGISGSIVNEIRAANLIHQKINYQPSFFGVVGTISHPDNTTTPDTPAIHLFEFSKKNPHVTEICVVDDKGKIHGMLTKLYLTEQFSGMYGYGLSSKKTVKSLIAGTTFLAADYYTPIETVSKMALARPTDTMYDAVVVTKNEQYYGIVTVKDLLEAAISIQIERATDANPLTLLPGNSIIQKHIQHKISSTEPYSIMYLDIDNFKAYNDSYGFNNGDLMIRAVSAAMEKYCTKNEFKGHIGGDDFVVIADYHDIEPLFHLIADMFTDIIQNLYSAEDLAKGYIQSVNRSGIPEQFPLATISAAVITNQNQHFSSIDEFSKAIAVTKKKSKQKPGNSITIFQPRTLPSVPSDNDSL